MLGIWVEKMIKCAMFYICLGVVKFDRLMWQLGRMLDGDLCGRLARLPASSELSETRFHLIWPFFITFFCTEHSQHSGWWYQAIIGNLQEKESNV